MMTGSNLPDDIDVLKAMILASQAEIAQRMRWSRTGTL